MKRVFVAGLSLLAVSTNTSGAEARSVHWHRAGASVFGGPCEYGSIGYRGDDLDVEWRSFAELGMGSAMGGLPYGVKVRVMSPLTHRRMTIRKLDVGSGGASVNGLPRDIDLRAPVAEWLAGASCSWTGQILWRRLG